jgi:hypothetical protein
MTDVTQKIKRTIIPTRAAVRHLPLFGFRPFASKIQASGRCRKAAHSALPQCGYDNFTFFVTAQRIFEIIKNTVIPERSYRESRNRLKLSSGFPLKIRGNDRQDYLHTLSSYLFSV